MIESSFEHKPDNKVHEYFAMTNSISSLTKLKIVGGYKNYR